MTEEGFIHIINMSTCFWVDSVYTVTYVDDLRNQDLLC